MRVNVYDPENIQKGRLILLNVAEDLKEHAKIDAIVKSPVTADDTGLDGACNANMEVLSLCFQGNGKADSVACWEGSIIPAS